MVKSHKQFRTGTLVMIGGLVASAVGVFVVSEHASDPANADKPALLAVGIGLTAVGGIIQIDSHKWIGGGGRNKAK